VAGIKNLGPVASARGKNRTKKNSKRARVSRIEEGLGASPTNGKTPHWDIIWWQECSKHTKREIYIGRPGPNYGPGNGTGLGQEEKDQRLLLVKETLARWGHVLSVNPTRAICKADFGPERDEVRAGMVDS